MRKKKRTKEKGIKNIWGKKWRKEESVNKHTAKCFCFSTEYISTKTEELFSSQPAVTRPLLLILVVLCVLFTLVTLGFCQTPMC